MKTVALVALAGAAALVEGHRFRANLAGQSLLRADDIFNFLHLAGAFTDCRDPRVLDANAMGITSFRGAEQACADAPSCSFFMLNTDEGKLYLCPDNKGFLKASPSSSWMIGVKPSVLQQTGVKTTLNKQAICRNVISQQTVATLDEAQILARDLGADVISVNLNKGAATGPSLPSMMAYFCHGATEYLDRNGFVTMESSPGAGPQAAATIDVPCGLNGSIQPDTAKVHEGIYPGEIVPASRVTATE